MLGGRALARPLGGWDAGRLGRWALARPLEGWEAFKYAVGSRK